MITQVPVVSHDPKSHVASYFNFLDLTNAMVPLTMSLVSHVADTIGNSATWQKCHAASHFNNFNLTNVMEQLTMPSVSCDTNTDANGVK